MPRRSATAVAASFLVGGITLALGFALAIAGCSSTSLSAAEVRVPVLLGPVPCIGCASGARLPAPMPPARVAARRRFYEFFVPLPPSGFGIADDTQRGISADRLLGWTSCLHDLQLSNVGAHSWLLTVPFLVYIYDVFVEADATEVLVPGASCPSL
jgi:hypothetical protein